MIFHPSPFLLFMNYIQLYMRAHFILLSTRVPIFSLTLSCLMMYYDSLKQEIKPLGNALWSQFPKENYSISESLFCIFITTLLSMHSLCCVSPSISLVSMDGRIKPLIHLAIPAITPHTAMRLSSLTMPESGEL